MRMLVSIATGIAEHVRRCIHRALQLLALLTGKINFAQLAQKFLTAYPHLPPYADHGLAVTLNLSIFAALDDPVQNLLAVVGKLCSCDFHDAKIPIFPIFSSAIELSMLGIGSLLYV